MTIEIQAGTAPRLENRTLRERVFEHLRDEILSGALEPGSELLEVPVASALGISRGPLREALGRLAAEGLVTITPRRGAVVTKLTSAEFIEAYQVREALESLAVRLAVPRLSDADRTRLHELAGVMARHVDDDDVDAFFEANLRFHDLFVRASGNRRLQQMHAQLIGQISRLMRMSHELRGGMEQSISEHRAILDAVDAGDAALAGKLLEEHIEVPQRVLDSDAAGGLFDDEPPTPSDNA